MKLRWTRPPSVIGDSTRFETVVPLYHHRSVEEGDAVDQTDNVRLTVVNPKDDVTLTAVRQTKDVRFTAVSHTCHIDSC